MATYIGQITFPTSDFVSGTQILTICSNNSVTPNTSVTDPFTTIDEYMDGIVVIISSLVGGTTTVTATTSGANQVVDFSIIDPTVTHDLMLNFVGLTFDINNYSTPIYLQECETTVCPTCQDLTFSACADSYIIEAGLTATTVYYVVIENNRNKRYVQVVETDGAGDFVIDATAPEFPIGFFTAEQMMYTLKVYSDSLLTQQQQLTVGNIIYNCITLDFINTVTTTSSLMGVDFIIDDEFNYIVDDIGNFLID